MHFSTWNSTYIESVNEKEYMSFSLANEDTNRVEQLRLGPFAESSIRENCVSPSTWGNACLRDFRDLIEQLEKQGSQHSAPRLLQCCAWVPKEMCCFHNRLRFRPGTQMIVIVESVVYE